MDQEAKKILSVIIAAAMAGVIYYGSYLPYSKSASLVNTMNVLQSGGGNGSQGITLQEFEDYFISTLSTPSPVGQYEVIRQMDMTIGSVLANTPNIPEASAVELANFALKYTQPIIDSGTGANYVQNFSTMGDIYREMGDAYKNRSFWDTALKYYQEGLIYSPRRPQFLYGELSIYLSEGDKTNALKVARKILAYWPDDSNTQKIVSQLESGLSLTPAGSPKK
ncbi:MAG: tetratricopeptide repeat protein [Patescibacteria group bacterium]|nr:tetratricopeptide repeat protein [Patescibacteria group bacterium]